MSLTDDIDKALTSRPPQYGCSVCKALTALPDDEVESLQKALSSTLGAKRLSLILKKHGIAVGVPSIHLHRTERHP